MLDDLKKFKKFKKPVEIRSAFEFVLLFFFAVCLASSKHELCFAKLELKLKLNFNYTTLHSLT